MRDESYITINSMFIINKKYDSVETNNLNAIKTMAIIIY